MPERKAKVAAVLTLDYMSSEESETDDEGKTVYAVKTLPWQSQDLKKKKKSLDKHHMESLPSLVRHRLHLRKEGGDSLSQEIAWIRLARTTKTLNKNI